MLGLNKENKEPVKDVEREWRPPVRVRVRAISMLPPPSAGRFRS